MALLHNCTNLTRWFVACLLASFSVCCSAAEEDMPDWKEDTLSGDWGGLRTAWYRKGVDIALSHMSDVLSNVSGGIKRGSAWEANTALELNLDLEKMLGWDKTSIYVLYHSQLGSKFNKQYVGSNAGVDSIEVMTNTAQFYQAWLEKNFYNEQLSILFGLYAVDSEFQINDSALLFINPVYGLNNELAASGRIGPSAYPLGALGARVTYTTPAKNFYIMGAITDGVPGDVDDPRGTHTKLGRGDGTFSIVEFGYTPQTEGLSKDAAVFNKYAIGVWGYSTRLPSLDSAVSKKYRSQGVYLLGEHSLYMEPNQAKQGLAGFVRLGFAPEETQQVDWTIAAGLRYQGLFDGRDDDIAGIAIMTSHASDLYRKLNQANRFETGVEITYRAQIKTWLALQPDVQYIVNPNMDLNLKDAWVLGLRTELTF